jgi:hypothetical protein
VTKRVGSGIVPYCFASGERVERFVSPGRPHRRGCHGGRRVRVSCLVSVEESPSTFAAEPTLEHRVVQGEVTDLLIDVAMGSRLLILSIMWC